MVAMIDSGVYAVIDPGDPLYSYADPVFPAPFSLIRDSG